MDNGNLSEKIAYIVTTIYGSSEEHFRNINNITEWLSDEGCDFDEGDINRGSQKDTIKNILRKNKALVPTILEKLSSSRNISVGTSQTNQSLQPLKQELIAILKEKAHLGIVDILEKINENLAYNQYDGTKWVDINSKITVISQTIQPEELVQATKSLINSIR